MVERRVISSFDANDASAVLLLRTELIVLGQGTRRLGAQLEPAVVLM